jgi:hypothetical protein
MVDLITSKGKISSTSKILSVAIHFSMLLASTQLNIFIVQMDPHTSILRYIS